MSQFDSGIDRNVRVGGRGGVKLQIIEVINEREEALKRLRGVLVRWPLSHGSSHPRIPPALLRSAPGVELSTAIREVRRLGLQIVELVEELGSITGDYGDFKWGGPAGAGGEAPYLAKMYTDLNFCKDIMKEDAEELFCHNDPLLLGPGHCHTLYSTPPPGRDHEPGSYAHAFGMRGEEASNVVEMQMAHERISQCWRENGMVDVAARLADPDAQPTRLHGRKGIGSPHGVGTLSSPSLGSLSTNGADSTRSKKHRKHRRGPESGSNGGTTGGSGDAEADVLAALSGGSGIDGGREQGYPSYDQGAAPGAFDERGASASSGMGADGRPLAASGSFRGGYSNPKRSAGGGAAEWGEFDGGDGEAPAEKHRSSKEKKRRKKRKKRKTKGDADTGGDQPDGANGERRRRKHRRRRERRRSSTSSTAVRRGDERDSHELAMGSGPIVADESEGYSDDDFESAYSSSGFEDDSGDDGNGSTDGGDAGWVSDGVFLELLDEATAALTSTLVAAADCTTGSDAPELSSAIAALLQTLPGGDAADDAARLERIHRSFRGVGLKYEAEKMSKVCAGLMCCVDTVVSAGVAAAEALAQKIAADPAHDESNATWSDAVRTMLDTTVRDAANQSEEELSYRSELEGVGTEGANSRIARIVAAAVGGLRAANATTRALPSYFFVSRPLSRALITLLVGSWRGDPVADGDAGPAKWIAPTLLAALGFEAEPSPTAPDNWQVLIDGVTKAALVHRKLIESCASVNGVVRRMPLTVSRSTAFDDAYVTLVKERVVSNDMLHDPLAETAPPTAAAVAPMFFSTFIGDAGAVYDDDKEAGAAGGGQPGGGVGVEEGEGHGPRKELFALASQQMQRKWAPAISSDSVVRGAAGSASLHGTGFATPLRPGFRIILHDRDGDAASATGSAVEAGLDDAEVFTVVRIVSADEVALSGILPRDVADCKFSYAAPCTALLEYRQSAEAYWPNSLITKDGGTVGRFRALGWLCGAALVNRCELMIRLPRIFFTLLLGHGAVLASAGVPVGDDLASQDGWRPVKPHDTDLKHFDEELHTTAVAMAELDQESLAQILETEELPDTMTAADYVKHMIKTLVVDSVAWQVDAVRAGFIGCIGKPGLSALRAARVNPDDLQQMVTGHSDAARDSDVLDLRSVFHVTYDAEMAACPEMQEALWSVVDAWPASKQRKLLRFVTGLASKPAPKSQHLRIEAPFLAFGLEDQRVALRSLPHAHTCANSLELPHYWKALVTLTENNEPATWLEGADDLARLRSVMDERLSLAVEATAGYGLDTVTRPDGAAELYSTLMENAITSPLARSQSVAGDAADAALYATTGAVSLDDLPTLGDTFGGASADGGSGSGGPAAPTIDEPIAEDDVASEEDI